MNTLTRLALPGVLVALGVLAAPAAAQSGQVLVVDASGGRAFTELQTAVDAAADGDTVLVHAGVYAPVSVVGKGLALVGSPGDVVTIVGGIELRDTLAGQTLVLENLRARGSHTQGSEHALVATDLAGALRVVDCNLLGGEGIAYGFPLEHGGDAARLHAVADASFADCVLNGGNGGMSFSGFSVNRGGDALFAADAQVSVHDSLLRGGNGGPGDFAGCDFGGAAGHGALLADGSTLFAAGNIAAGGNGGGDDFLACNPGGDGVRVGAASALVTLLDNTLVGGSGACGQPAGLPMSNTGGGASLTLSGNARGFDAPTPTHEAQPAAFAFQGEPGDGVYVLLSANPGQRFLPKFHGTLLAGFPLLGQPLALGTIPAGGTLEVSLPLPALPAGVDALWAHLQPVFRDTQRALWLGEPRVLVVLDAAL